MSEKDMFQAADLMEDVSAAKSLTTRAHYWLVAYSR